MKQAAGMFCKGCGYDLGGIGSGPCPECARAFDAGDQRTFDPVPRRARRRMLLRRLAAGVGALFLAAALFPRGYAQGQLSIPRAGGGADEFSRVELFAPRWLSSWTGLHYPGWTWTTAGAPGSGIVTFKATGYRFTVRGREPLGTCTASAGGGPGSPVWAINGAPVTPANAGAVFATVLPGIASGQGFGVRIGPARPEGAGP